MLFTCTFKSSNSFSANHNRYTVYIYLLDKENFYLIKFQCLYDLKHGLKNHIILQIEMTQVEKLMSCITFNTEPYVYGY